MHEQGEFKVRSPAARVYGFFLDPVSLTDCLDDPHEIRKVDADHFEGTVTSGIAFIRGTFRVRGVYGLRTPPSELHAHVQGAGLGSGLEAEIEVHLAEESGGTTVQWLADVTPSGPIATIGERMIRGTLEKKLAGLFENARRKLETG